MSVNKEIIDRLICAKYMFQHGNELLERGGPFSDGLTVLLFQDSVEMCLRAIAEQHHCSMKDNIAFNQIMDEIDKIGIGLLTHRTALNQLNKARLNFKHFGLQTKHEDVVKFRKDLEAFFPSTLNTFLNLSYDSISLIDLIEHCRVRNHLRSAERFIESGKYRESIQSSAVAFHLYRSYSSIFRERKHRKRLPREIERDVHEFLKYIEDSINQQQDQISLIMDGVNLGDYRRFLREIPIVHMSDAKTFEIVWFSDRHNDESSRDIAVFCLRFAIDSILLIQQYKLPTSFRIKLPERRFKVLHDCDIIVWPSNEPEVIRQAKAGEILQGYYENFDKPDYIAITQDDESAYVKRVCLEIAP
jgi:hypothetical protein